MVKIIEKEIGVTQTLHTDLLREAAGFTREYDQVLKVRRKAIFTERFNFNHEFEKQVTQNRKPEVLKFLFEPLLNPAVRKRFNPLRILEPQRVSFVRSEESERVEEEKDTERLTVDMVTEKRVRGNFVFYAGELLKELEVSGEVYLKDFCQRLVEKYGDDAVYNGDFISFVLEMNRGKNLGEHSRVITLFAGKGHDFGALETVEDVFSMVASKLGLDGINRLVVRSFPEEDLEILPGLKMTNLLFTGEKKR